MSPPLGWSRLSIEANGADAATMFQTKTNAYREAVARWTYARRITASCSGWLTPSLFPGVSSAATVSRLDVELRAEILDLCADLMEVVASLPPRTYTRQRLCDQLNSCLVARGWGTAYGTVE